MSAGLVSWHQHMGRLVKSALPPAWRIAYRARRSWAEGEPELHLLPKLCSAQAWAIDVGANNGVYAWHLARWSAGVTAFEPQRAHAQLLARAFGKRVTVEQVALSDQTGERLLRVPLAAHQDGRATIEPQNRLGEAAYREDRIQCRRLDSYDFPTVGLIKIDVEGHELGVLRGARRLLRRDLPHLIVEAEECHRAHALPSLCAFLGPLGYRPYLWQGQDLHPLGEGARSRTQINVVFLARPIRAMAARGI